jgi:hypothetical protein
LHSGRDLSVRGNRPTSAHRAAQHASPCGSPLPPLLSPRTASSSLSSELPRFPNTTSSQAFTPPTPPPAFLTTHSNPPRSFHSPQALSPTFVWHQRRDFERPRRESHEEPLQMRGAGVAATEEKKENEGGGRGVGRQYGLLPTHDS